MIIRLVCTIIVLVVIAFFAGFNLDNRCNINLLFYTFKEVPVFFTIIFSFIAGIIFTIPFAFFSKIRKKGRIKEDNTAISLKSADTSSGAAEDKKQNIQGD